MKHSPAFLKLCEAARENIQEISVREAAEAALRPDAHLVDVREESEFAAGHAVDAMHLSKGVIERDIEERIPDKSRQVLLYCGGGFRSALAAEQLQKMGYSQVFSVAGGWRAWKEAKLPITTLPEVLPRSPYEKLGGLYHLPRLIDKCRLVPKGKLPGYHYLDRGFDKELLEFLCVDPSSFENAANAEAADQSILVWLKSRLGPGWPSDHAITQFNSRLSARRPEGPDQRDHFDHRLRECPPTKKRVETYMDLIDAEEGRVERLNRLD